MRDAATSKTSSSASLTDAEAAARIAIAVEDGDEEALLEAIRQAEASRGLSEDIIREMAAMLMGAEEESGL